jgi:Zn-dependent M28 family amino/carboxypeptidase
MTYYGRWTYKYEEAARQGAIGFLVIHETAPASYGWATVKNSNTNEIFDVIRKDPSKDHAPLEGWIQRDAPSRCSRPAARLRHPEEAGPDPRLQAGGAEGRDLLHRLRVDAQKVVSTTWWAC